MLVHIVAIMPVIVAASSFAFLFNAARVASGNSRKHESANALIQDKWKRCLMPVIRKGAITPLTANAMEERTFLHGGSTPASVLYLPDFRGKGPAVKKAQPSDRRDAYLRERNLFIQASKAGLDLAVFPSLYDHDDDSNTLTMSFIDDTGGPPLQTVAFKNNITAELHHLALKHGIFHNDVKWDNIKYDRHRSRAVLFDFDWATSGAPGFPYYAQLHLPVTVGTRREVKSLCAVAGPADSHTKQDQPEEVWLYSLDDKGTVLEHHRDATQWTQRDLTKELRLPSIRACACALDDPPGSRVLYFVDAHGALHELQLRPAQDAPPPRPQCISRAQGWRMHAESEVVSVAVPEAGRAPARGIVLIDAKGRLRLAIKRAGEAGGREDAQWECDVLQPDPPPSLAPGARIAAGVVGGRVTVFYCSGEKRPALCQATWQGPGLWVTCRVELGTCSLSDSPVRPRSLSAIFNDEASIAYVSCDAGKLWEVKVLPSPGGRQGRACCLTDDDYRERRLRRVADGPVVAGQLPRSRAEGGGLAGREVVVVRGDGDDAGKFLHRFFLGGDGCGALEGRGIKTWQMQYLNMADEGFRSPALASDRVGGPAICLLATAGGTHHVFYAAAGGVIVEL